MKKIFLLAVIAIAFTCTSFAQSNPNNMPKVRLGNIKGVEKVNGNWVQDNITRQDLISNSKLVVEGSCQIVSYSVGIMPNGHNSEFKGPYTVTNSADFTQSIKDVIATLDDKGGRIFIENIKVNCNGAEKTATPIVFRYK